MKKFTSILSFPTLTTLIALTTLSTGLMFSSVASAEEKAKLNLPAKLTIAEDSNYILFDGKKLNKEEANSLEALERFQITKKDVVLVRHDTGEKACPAKFFFVVVDKDTAIISDEFGTCSPEIKTSRLRNKVLVDNSEFQPNKKTQYSLDLDGSVVERLKK